MKPTYTLDKIRIDSLRPVDPSDPYGRQILILSCAYNFNRRLIETSSITLFDKLDEDYLTEAMSRGIVAARELMTRQVETARALDIKPHQPIVDLIRDMIANLRPDFSEKLVSGCDWESLENLGAPTKTIHQDQVSDLCEQLGFEPVAVTDWTVLEAFTLYSMLRHQARMFETKK